MLEARLDVLPREAVEGLGALSQHWDSQWRKTGDLLSKLGGVVPSDFRRTGLTASIEPVGAGSKYLEDYCDRAGVPEWLREDTLVGDPSAKFLSRGQWVTHVSLRHAYFAHTLISFLGVDHGRLLTVLEVGAGYGGLSAKLCKALNVDTYVFVDAEPSLALQRSFSGEAIDLRQTRTVFLTPDDEWRDAPDLIVNTHSFAEMDRADVLRYFYKIQEVLPEGGIFYSVNLLAWRVSSFGDYPFDPKWRHEVLRMSRYNERYVESLSVRDHGVESPHPVELLREQG